MGEVSVAIGDLDGLADAACARASDLLTSSLARQTRKERRRAARLGRMLADQRGRDLLLVLTDSVVRIHEPSRAMQALRQLVAGGTPRALGPIDRAGLRTLALLSRPAPRLCRRLVDWRLDRDTRGVILDADDPALAEYLATRRAEGFALNVNVLGEAITSLEQAADRLDRILTVMARPDVTYVSVKASAVVYDLDALAFDDSVERIADRLRVLYRHALAQPEPVTVNLDMEEHRDLEVSVAAFERVLLEPEFAAVRAGIVLQAYLPDSHDFAARVVSLQRARQVAGAEPIKVRLVKGANLAMEAVEAELHGLEQAPYASKSQTDASYKKLLVELAHESAVSGLRLGVASHNLFDVAFALELVDRLGIGSLVDFEMLEGMAPSQAAALKDLGVTVLLYAPVVSSSDRDSSIAYLSRRLDENSSAENFLRAMFTMTPGSPAWLEQEARFRESVSDAFRVSTWSRRRQDRALGVTGMPSGSLDGFRNCPDTDFTRPSNRDWVTEAISSPLQAAVAPIDTPEVDQRVAAARAAAQAWRVVPVSVRRRMLSDLVDVLEADRGRAIATLVHEGFKTVREADPEVSEAVDFVSYAAHCLSGFERRTSLGLEFEPFEVTVVAGPFNFPYAIPMCGVVNAVAAGGAVLLKPSPGSRRSAALIVEQFNRAGFPSGLVQLAPTDDDDAGKRLITHPDVSRVVLTGAGSTADMFRSWRPGLRLSAETSGKNAIIVTAAADIDQAVKDVVRSAFGHAGQKCSAASLVIVTGDVLDEGVFTSRLAAAVRSLGVGQPSDLTALVTPLAAPLTRKLERALTELEPGESWLVEPVEVEPGLWSPGVRLGVRPGSWFHLTECFGPVLGVMRADSLAHAVELQNGTEFGLTGGLQSLDVDEQDYWLERVQVGNAYVNRPITGAVVSRQPFGGWKSSSVGVAGKPGGPHHLDGYGHWHDNRPPRLAVEAALDSFSAAYRDRFAHGRDDVGLDCEANVLRYVPLPLVIAYAHPDDVHRPLLELAARVTGVPLTMTSPAAPRDALIELIETAPAGSRLRALEPLSDEVREAALRCGIDVDDAPATGDGFTELPHWLLEQSVSVTAHRLGRPLSPSGLPRTIRPHRPQA